MADLYYIDSGYLTPDAGYYTYIADGAAAPSSQFTISCVIGKLQSATATFTSAFSPTLSITVFKNSFAVLDCPTALTSIPTVNRSITQTLNNIATLNAMAAKTTGFNSSLTSMATASATATSVKSSTSALTSTATLSVDALNVQLASAALSSTSSLTASRYLGMGRPRDSNNSGTSFTYSSSIKKFGSHSVTTSGNNVLSNLDPSGGFDNNYPRPMVPAPTRSWAFEGWVYPRTSDSTARELFTIGSSRSSNRWFTIYIQSGTLYFEIYNSSGSIIYSASQASAFTNDSWNHVLVIKNSSALSLYVNGTRVYNSTSNLTTAYYPIIVQSLRVSGNWPAGNAPYFDDVSFHIGTTLGFDPTSSSITIPTAQRLNDPDTTMLLWHFNNDRLDDISYIAEATANLSSSFTVTTLVNETQSLAAALTSTATVTASASRTRSIASDLTSISTLSATATRIQEAVASLSTTATQIVTATRIVSTAQANLSTTASLACAISVTRDSASALSSSTVSTVDYTRTRSLASAFTSAFSPTLIATAQRAGVALLESVTALSASTARTRLVQADLTSTATVAVNAGRLISAAAAIASQSTVTIDAKHLVGVSITANSQFTTACDISRIRTVSTALSSAVTLSAAVSRTRNVNGTLSTAFTESATVLRIQSGNVAVSSTVSVTANAVKTARGVVTVTSQFTQNINAVKTVGAVSNFSAIATELAVAVKNATGTITMSSTASLSAAVGVIKPLVIVPQRGARFDRGGSYLSYTDNSLLPQILVQGDTISFWMRKQNDDVFGYILSSRQEAGVSWKLNITYQDRTSLVWTNQALTAPNQNTELRWINVIPVDYDWHHYMMVLDPWPSSSPFGTKFYIRLYRDGEFISRQETPGGSVGGGAGYWWTPLHIGNDAYQSDPIAANVGQIDILQLWIGELNHTYTGNQSNWTSSFYDQGFVDLGSGQIGSTTPFVYEPLTVPYSGKITASTGSVSDFYGDYPLDAIAAIFRVSAQPVVNNFLNQTDLGAVSALSAQINAVARANSTLSVTATVTANAQQRIGVISNQSVTATVSANVYRIKQFAATVSTVSTVSILGGYLKLGSGSFSATATVVCEATEIQAIQGSAVLTAQFTVSAAVNERQGFIITPSSQFSVACDATVKPPIRITAGLTSTVTVTATLTRVQAFSVTLNSLFTVTADTTKIKGVIANLSSNSTVTVLAGRRIQGAANLQVQAFELTQGDILNFAPELTLYVTQETRIRKVLPENRLYSIDSESRTRKVIAESRIITIEQETEVNII